MKTTHYGEKKKSQNSIVYLEVNFTAALLEKNKKKKSCTLLLFITAGKNKSGTKG